MKPGVAVTFIVMGTLLLLAPMGADYLYQRNYVALLTHVPPVTVPVLERLNNWYRVGCWLAGALMLLVSTLASIPAPGRRSDYTEEEEEEEEDEA